LCENFPQRKKFKNIRYPKPQIFVRFLYDIIPSVFLSFPSKKAKKTLVAFSQPRKVRAWVGRERMSDGRVLKFSIGPPSFGDRPTTTTVVANSATLLPSTKRKRDCDGESAEDEGSTEDLTTTEDDSFSITSLLGSLPTSSKTTPKTRQKEISIEEITIDYVKTQLTPHVVSRLYIDLIKYLLYTRQQIPL